MPQIKIYDAENKRIEEIELAAARDQSRGTGHQLLQGNAS